MSPDDPHPCDGDEQSNEKLSRSAFRARPSPLTGQVLAGRYEVIGLVGAGGTADVYLAEDRAREALVLVKYLREFVASDEDARARFLAEARAAMAIDHPAVVRIFGVEQPDGPRPFLVMEALVGEPLGEYLRREERVPKGLVVELARAAASGLAAAHAVGVIHRDVKPDNLLLLGPVGAPSGLKLIDFGHAKDLNRRGSSTADMVIGTAQYMAPEQVLSDPVDARTDVYGLGVVMFRMLTGHLPFDADPGVDLLSHQLFSPTPPPSWLDESIDPRLEAVILRAMRKHPENRYPTMGALLADLDDLVARGGAAGNRPVVPLARMPDVYKPRNPKGREVAGLLAARFGAESPPPPSSQVFELVYRRY